MMCHVITTRLGSEKSSTRCGGCVELLRRGKGSPDDVPRRHDPPRQREVEQPRHLQAVLVGHQRRRAHDVVASARTHRARRRTSERAGREGGRGGGGGEGIISLPRPVEGWWREDTVRSVAAVVAVVGARVVRGQRRAVVAIVVRLVHRTARTFERIARGQRPVEVGDDGQLRRRRRAELPSRGAERFADVERLRLGLRARGSATAVEVVEGRGDEPHDSTTTRSRTRARKRCG